MGRLFVSVTDQVRSFSSESSSVTILTVDSTPIHFEGSIEDRRAVAIELARSLGLIAIYPTDVLYPTGTVAGLEHLIAVAHLT